MISSYNTADKRLIAIYHVTLLKTSLVARHVSPIEQIFRHPHGYNAG
jgi:hypothetical protein